MKFLIACECNLEGSTNSQCYENHQCICKANITGLKCDSCFDNDFGFPNCLGMYVPSI